MILVFFILGYDGIASIKEINAGEFTLTLDDVIWKKKIYAPQKANAEIRECLKIFSFPKESLTRK